MTEFEKYCLSADGTRIRFEGFDHYSPEEKTQEIATALNDFFSNSN